MTRATMVDGVVCESCGSGLTFTNEGAYCEPCKARSSKWTNDELRALYLKLDPEVLETDASWWEECLAVVRLALLAPHDDKAVEIVRAAGWGDMSYASRLRRLAGIPQTEHTCPTCAGSGKVRR